MGSPLGPTPKRVRALKREKEWWYFSSHSIASIIICIYYWASWHCVVPSLTAAAAGLSVGIGRALFWVGHFPECFYNRSIYLQAHTSQTKAATAAKAAGMF